MEAHKPAGPPLGLKCVVIGGGVGGLTAARALLDAGAEVHIFERRSLEVMLGGPSGLSLNPNAMAALSLLSGSGKGSLADDVAAAGSTTHTFLMAAQSGRLLNSMGAEPGRQQDVGSVVANITRPALQRTLYAALPPGIVTCSASFRSFEQREGGRVAVRLAVGGKEVEEECDVLVGADGIRSTVRRHLEGSCGLPPRSPTFSGYHYYRALADLTKWPGGVKAWMAGMEGRMSMLYGSAKGSGGAIVYQVGPFTVCWGRYAVPPRKGGAAATPQEAWEDLQALCKGWGSPIQELLSASDPSTTATGELWSLPPAPSVWGAGGITLAGDAAHAMLPALGQGACQAIESGVELAGMLHRAVRDKAAGGGAAALSAAEVAQVLRQYEAARGPHVARVQAAAEGAFRSCVGESRLGRTLRDWVLWLLPSSVLRAVVAGAWMTERRFSWEGPPTVGPPTPPASVAK